MRIKNLSSIVWVSLAIFQICHTASLKDILISDDNDDKKLTRVAREDKLYLDRYGGNGVGAGTSGDSLLNTRLIKPEESVDNIQPPETNLGKRCIRCESRNYYPNRYDYDEYDRRNYGNYRDRDRYEDRYYDRFERDRDRDRYDQRSRDFYDRDRVYDRGIGYDNRGYDYRDYWDNYKGRDYYNRAPPSYYDDRDDISGRDYDRRPPPPYYDYYGSGYANRWNYKEDPYRSRERERYPDEYRYRDYGYYRPTSYLYGRPQNVPLQHSTTMNPTKNDSTENSNSG